MGTIKVENLEHGMILTKDVKNHFDVVVLRGESIVTEKSLRILKMWGISEVEVQGIAEEDIIAMTFEQTNPGIFKDTEEYVSNLFKHTDKNHPAIKELFQQCVLRIIKEGEGDNSNGE